MPEELPDRGLAAQTGLSKPSGGQPPPGEGLPGPSISALPLPVAPGGAAPFQQALASAKVRAKRLGCAWQARCF